MLFHTTEQIGGMTVGTMLNGTPTPLMNMESVLWNHYRRATARLEIQRRKKR